MAEQDKKVKIKLSADTKEAVRSIRDLERQVDKLGDLADQGQRRQQGFLSPRQVDMYKRILSEIEKTKSTHQKNLERMEDEYGKRREGKEAQQLKKLEQDLKKRQDMLKRAEGGNKWGDTASPIIQEFHRSKLDEAKTNLKTYQQSDEYRKNNSEVTRLEAEIKVMKSTVQSMQSESNRGAIHSDRISEMHQMDANQRRYMNGMAGMVGASGALHSLTGYVGYTLDGMDMLRQQEASANPVALNTRAYEGETVDDQHRTAIRKLGAENGYNASDTANLQRNIIAGGTTGDVEALNKDTDAVQKFSRSYSVEANSMATGGAMLQRMGTLEEGEQRRFADLLAGAISKGNMGGREEEMLRATTALAESVSNGQSSFSNEQLQNVMGLQVALGNAVPELSGERGASLLSNMDSAIKGGGNELDLLMGKGVEFTGLKGMEELQTLKEQGLSNPENLQRVLKGADRMFGGNETMTKFALKEQLGLNLNEYNAMKESGLLDQIKEDPNSVTAQDLGKAGAKDLSKQWGTYDKSNTAQVQENTAKEENLKATHAQPAEETATDARSLWQQVPEPLQHLLLPASAIGGGLLAGKYGRKIIQGAYKKVMPTIGQSGKGGGGLKGALSKAGDTVKAEGGSLLSKANESGFTKGALKTAGSMGKRVPIIGTAVGATLDQMENPENDLMRSITKGVGGTLGGIAGFAGGTALGLGTGGVGLAAVGATTVGGAMAGEQAGDWLYDLFNGKDDKLPKDASAPATKLPEDTSAKPATGSDVSSIHTDSLSINSKDFASYFEGKGKAYAEEGGKKASGNNGMPTGEYTLKVVLEGNIEGMDKGNQQEVTTSIKDFFSSMVSPYGGGSKYNLSLDQQRG